MNQPRIVGDSIHRFLPTEIEGFDLLAELALDMLWSWNHSTDKLWRQLDPTLWELTQNPWVVLQTVARDKLERVLSDPDFRKSIDELLRDKRAAEAKPAWFQQLHAESRLKCVAYFSMEFMLSEALPIYSGGLGNVAGDQLKAASDLGVPVVGVGLLYQQGYFRQEIDKDGAQQALYPYNDPGQLPITPLRQPNGEWLRLEIALPGYSVWLRAWQVQVGRVKLYLLDSNDAANFPAHRGITSELYGGGPELRLKQEMVLGIGGWRLCQEAGLVPIVEPEVLMDGEHTLERCRKVTEEVLRNVFIQLNCQRVLLEGMILKPNMVLPGLTCPTPAIVDEVADTTVKSLWRTVPTAVPGIAFLSGGQSSELASARLNAMNFRFKSRLPWALAFSFARAIQQPALEIWQGQESNVKAAQQALLHRARCNRAARRGEYAAAMETK